MKRRKKRIQLRRGNGMQNKCMKSKGRVKGRGQNEKTGDSFVFMLLANVRGSESHHSREIGFQLMSLVCKEYSSNQPAVCSVELNNVQGVQSSCYRSKASVNNHSICGSHSIANIEVSPQNVHLIQAEQDIGKFTASPCKKKAILSVWHVTSLTSSPKSQ